MVFEMGLEGCTVVDYVEKRKKKHSWHRKEHVQRYGGVSEHGVAGHESSKADWGRPRKGPERHVHNLGALSFGTG